MKLIHLFLILILSLPFTFASIEITSELKGEYYLGDDIFFSIKILPDKTANALIKSTLKCADREVLYYIAPISLEQGKEIDINIPKIEAFSEGLCSIWINMESMGGESLGGITSPDFTISSKLQLSFISDKTEALPGDKIKIEGTAKKGEENIEGGIVAITFDGKEEQIELIGDRFTHTLKLGNNIKSGMRPISVRVSDSYGNFNEGNGTINVKAIPTVLEFQLNKKEFLPKESLQLTVQLLDQAGDPIFENIGVKLSKERILFEDEVLFDRQAEANKGFDFTFAYNTTPGEYTLRGSSGDLEKKEIINILVHSEIKMRLEGDTVFIENIGNVEYKNETTIILEKDGKTYFINKNIKLDVGEGTAINLSKEMPSGTYTVTLPAETVIEEKVVEKTVEKIVEKEVPVQGEEEDNEEEAGEEAKIISEEKEGNVIKNVKIEDDRPFYKKGLSMITGGVVAGTGLLLKRPGFASLAMVIVIIITISYFSRKRIGKVIDKIRERRVGKF